MAVVAKEAVLWALHLPRHPAQSGIGLQGAKAMKGHQKPCSQPCTLPQEAGYDDIVEVLEQSEKAAAESGSELGIPDVRSLADRTPLMGGMFLLARATTPKPGALVLAGLECHASRA